MSNELHNLEHELKEYRLQLETVQSGLQADPGNVDLTDLETELNQAISLTETAISELRPESPPKQSKDRSRDAPGSSVGGFRRGGFGQDASQDGAEVPSTASYQVNDHVLARWVSGDNSFYPARITSITGSKNSPVYIVTFKSYATTDTLSAKDIKPVSSDARKRKAGADGSTPSGNATPPSHHSPAPSNVISAAAHIDESLASQAKREPSKVSDGPPKPPKVPRKVKANKELEAGKNKWKEFATKGKASKVSKKESMFRTPEGIHGRVGFTGSGQSMRKDVTRSKHIYQQGGEEEQY